MVRVFTAPPNNPWTELPLWDGHCAEEYHIYTDGPSSVRGTGGAAVLCFTPPLFTRGFARAGPMAPMVGISRLGSMSSPSVPEATHPEPLPLVRSMARLELPLSILDLATIDTASSLRSLAHPDSSAFLLGCASLGLVMSALSSTTFDFLLSSHSLGQLGSSPLVPDSCHADSPVFLRSLAWTGSTAPILGLSRLGSLFFLSAIDKAALGSFPLIQSSAHLGPFLLALGPCSAGSSLPAHTLARAGLVASTSGLSRVGLVSFLPVVDSCTMGSLPSSQSLACADLPVPAADLALIGFAMLLRSFACLGPSALALNLVRSGSSVSARSSAQLAPGMPFVGISRVGPVFSLSVPHATEFGSPPPLRSSAQVDSPPFVLDAASFDSTSSVRSPVRLSPAPLISDHGHVGLPPSPQGLGRTGPAASVLGLQRPGPVSSLPVIDLTSSGLPLSLRSMSHLGLAASVPDPLRLGPAPPARQPARSGGQLSATCATQLEPFSSVSGASAMGSSPFLRSFAWPEAFLPVLDACHLGPTVPSQDPARLGPPALVLGLARSGSVFAPSVIDNIHIDSLMFVQSFMRLSLPLLATDLTSTGSSSSLQSPGHPEPTAPAVGLSYLGFIFFLSVIDATHFDPVLFARSFAHPGFAALASDLAAFGLPTSFHSSGHLEPALSALGPVRVNPTPSIVDVDHVGFTASVRSFARSGSAALAPDPVHFGSPTPAKSLVRLGSAALTSGIQRPGSLYSLPVIDKAMLGPPLSLHSPACSESASLVLDFLRPGPSLSVRGSVRLGLLAPMAGLSRAGSVFPLLISDCREVEPSLLLRSPAWLDLSLSTSYAAHLEPLLLLRSSSRLDSQVLLSGVMCVGLALLVFNICTLGSLMSLRSFACLGPTISALDLAHMGSSLSTHSYGRLDSTAFTTGMSRLGLISSLLVLDDSMMGLFPLIRSTTCLGPPTFALDLLHPSSLSPLRFSARSGSSASPSGTARVGSISSLSATSLVNLGPLPSARSLARSELAALVSELSGLGSPSPLRSLA